MMRATSLLQYFRNRIRLELIPYLQEFNPQIKPHILQTTRILAEEESVLEKVKMEAWENCFDRRSEHWISFHLAQIEDTTRGFAAGSAAQGNVGT